MSLPTTNLTLHLNASVNTNIWKNSNGTGVPVDGDAIQRWDDEGDGIGDIAMIGVGANSTIWRQSTPLMRLPCLDFNGSVDEFTCRNDADSANHPISDLITNSAFTVAVAVYPEVIASSNANTYDNDAIFIDTGGFWGLVTKDVAGVKQIRGYNWDGSDDSIGATVATGRTWIAIYRHDTGNLKLTVIADTRVETTPADVPSGNTSSLTGVMHIGSGFGGHHYNGRIGEMAFYNASLTGSALTDLKNYFMDKWFGSQTRSRGQLVFM
jgi:hypothetical protein